MICFGKEERSFTWNPICPVMLLRYVNIALASEYKVAVAYYCENREEDWDGSSIKIVDSTSSNEPIAIIVFDRCTSHYFGPPNDEAFSGHPLAKVGLEPYGSFEVIDSSWIRKLEQMSFAFFQ